MCWYNYIKLKAMSEENARKEVQDGAKEDAEACNGTQVDVQPVARVSDLCAVGRSNVVLLCRT